jgi:hypothetical protein
MANFWKAYTALSLDMRKKAQRAYQLWQDNPMHPSLHFKKIGKTLWSVRIRGGLSLRGDLRRVIGTVMLPLIIRGVFAK